MPENQYTVTLTVVGQFGATSTCTSLVTVKDTLKPVAICRNVDLTLDSSGRILLNPGTLDNGS